MRKFLTQNEKGEAFYSKTLIESVLWLGHVIDIESIFGREISNGEFEKLLLNIVKMSSFDEISIYIVHENKWVFKKTFFKNGNIELKFVTNISKETHLNLHNLLNWTKEKTEHGYFVSKVPAPWIGEDFVLELEENVFIAGDNYSQAEDISVYLSVIEMIAMSISHIIKQKKLIEELLKDELTGLYNKKAWNQEQTESWFLITVDIDLFKSVNDTYGHDVGDTVLKKVAETIINSLRIEDKAFRLGGEEFCIYVKESRIEIALKIAERIRKRIEDVIHQGVPLNKNEDSSGQKKEIESFKRTISIGVSEIIDGGKEDALKKADENLYLAKNQGKNRIYFEWNRVVVN